MNVTSSGDKPIDNQRPTRESGRSSKRWKATTLGLALILIGLVVWDGIDRRSADASRPLNRSSDFFSKTTPPQTLKLGSFNIHSGKGTDGKRDLGRVARFIKDVDFVGLYEVRAAGETNQPNQAAVLSSHSEMAWLFAPTERQWWFDHFGNAALSRIPVHSTIRFPLVNTRGKAYRNAILSTVELQSTTVRILAVHIDREADRQHQLQTIVDLFMGLQEPCVLMGDLNTPANDPIILNLRQRTGVRSPLHEEPSAKVLDSNIDWVFTRGLKTISATLVENDASDHPFLKAEFAP